MKKLWQKIHQLIRSQLTQGATPEGLALCCAIGVMIGNFPIMGTTTIICALLGLYLELNQPVLQLANYMMLIPQLIMIPIFLWIGETLTGSSHISLNPQQLMQDFMAAPLLFFRNFGMAAVHTLIAWALIAPFMGLTTYFIMRFVFRRTQGLLAKGKTR